MSKDPAFLFYSQDFLMGTITMSDAEIGMYVRILCVQHQTCHIDAEAMRKLCGGDVPASVLAKFKIDGDGKYYNERLENEMLARKEKGRRNKKNAEMRWGKNIDATTYAKPHAKIMPFTENENVIENENTNEEIGGVGENPVAIENVDPDPAGLYHPDKFSETRDGIYEITRYLNSKTGGSLNPEHSGYCSSIWRRLQEGYTFEQMKAIIDVKAAEWMDSPKMRIHLNPTTLFSEENFDKYLNETTLPPITKDPEKPSRRQQQIKPFSDKLIFDRP